MRTTPPVDRPIPRWLHFVLISDRAGSAWYIGLGFFFAPVLAVLSPWPARHRRAVGDHRRFRPVARPARHCDGDGPGDRHAVEHRDTGGLLALARGLLTCPSVQSKAMNSALRHD